MELLIYDRDYEVKDGYKKGDIVEVRPDGFWSKDHDWNRKAFKVALLPGIDVNKALIEAEYKDDILVQKRAYSVNISSTENKVSITSTGISQKISAKVK